MAKAKTKRRVLKGRWRCAKCDCIYNPKKSKVVVRPYPSCPDCGEAEDVFPADDGGWDEKKISVRESSYFYDDFL